MTTDPTPTAVVPAARRALPAPAQFRVDVTNLATQQLMEILGSDEGKAAAARVGLAFAAAARTARDPGALYACSRESVATAVAMSALTNLMPGGPAAAVWLVPKAGELGWWLSHRGIAALCLRAGYQVLAVPVHVNDDVRVEFGEVTKHEPSGDYPASIADLAGVYLTIRRLENGAVLCRPWCARALIESRRKVAGTEQVWNKWPVEMAQKTAIKWALSRGLLPVDGIEIGAALAAEPHEDEPVPALTPSQRDTRRGAAIATALDEPDPEPDPDADRQPGAEG